MGRNKERILTFVLFLGIGSINAVFARTIEVCPEKTCQIHKIKEALNLAQDGDTILIGGGYYYEGNLRIDKSITLYSDENAVIDGEFKNETLTITAPNVLVTGLCFQNTGHSSIDDIAAIHILNAHHVRILRNCIEDAFFGILSENASECVIANNQLSGTAIDENVTGNGIHSWQCSRMSIASNGIHGYRDGIYMEFVSNSEIGGNHSHDNLRYGLHFMFSNHDVYRKNTFERNGAGVAVMFSKQVDMYENQFRGNWGNAAFGLLLKEISGGHIMYNKFQGNTTGAFFEGSSHFIIKFNQFEKNGWAFKIQASCENMRIDSNNFFGNTFDIATNGTLVLNTFDHNYWDKYEGYDLNRDGLGDVPYQPVSLYSMITEKNPQTLLLMRSFLTTMLDRAEKVVPAITPVKLKDNQPLMHPVP